MDPVNPGYVILFPIAYFFWLSGYIHVAFIGLFVGLFAIATLAYWLLSDLYDQVK